MGANPYRMPRTLAQARIAALAPVMLAAILLAGSPLPAAAQPAGDLFADRGWHLEISADLALETWNYNGNREEMYGVVTGFTYGLRDGLVFTASAPLYYVSQRGVDAFLLGGTFGVRGRLLRIRRATIFAEFQVGISQADTTTPPRGTRFNYLALGGAGVTVPVSRTVHVLAALKWVHVSNASLAGRDRNPDIEAVGPRVGLLIGF
jgi:hypothetical protein